MAETSDTPSVSGAAGGTVFVVDDDVEMRDSLQWLIETIGLKVRSFASGSEFRKAYRAGEAGCLLLDFKMPHQSGIELYEQLLSEGFRLPVIFMSAHADVETVVTAMKTGAIEFLEKPFDRKSLIDKIVKALEIDRGWREREQELDAVDQQIATLTPRERETLTLIMAGEPNKRIAAHFDVSERAIEMRRARIMSKLEVTTLAELLDRAITHRLRDELRAASRSRPAADEGTNA